MKSRSVSRKHSSPFESFEARRLMSITLGADLPKTTFVDSSGDTVTLALNGPGSAVVTLANGDSGDIRSIAITGTSTRTSLVASVRGADTTLGDITTDGSLKSIVAPKADLDGNITIAGTLSSLAIRNTIGAQSISINAAGGSTSLKLGNVDDLLVSTAGALGKVSAAHWTAANPGDAGIRAAALKTLAVTGDLSADIDLSATDTASLGSASIKGSVLGGTWNIGGDARSISIKGNAAGWHLVVGRDVRSLSIKGTLSADNLINVTNSARSVRLSTPVTLAAPDSGPVTQVRVGGSGIVSSPGQKAVRISNASVFSNSAISYSLADLQNQFNEGNTWTYVTTYAGGSNKGEVRTTVRLDDFSQNNSTGETQATLSTTVDTVTTSLKWLHNSAGTFLKGWTVGTDAGNFNLSFDPLQVAAEQLVFGEPVSSSTAMTGQFQLTNGVTITGQITGTASSVSRLMGHEQVTTPSGTYTAAKVQVALTLNGSIDVNLGDGNTTLKFVASQVQTLWLVPTIGPVRVTTAWRVTGSLPGGGSSTSRFSTDSLLDSFVSA
jgi:hypothetical protein